MRKEFREDEKSELSPDPAITTTEITDPRPSSAPRLKCREEVSQFLQLDSDQVQFLINTQQIVPIRIVGAEPFDARDLERLIDTYKATALRRAE
jgi:hypothetical protein